MVKVAGECGGNEEVRNRKPQEREETDGRRSRKAETVFRK